MYARIPVAGAKGDGVRSLERFFQASPSPGWTGSTGILIFMF